MSKDIRSFFVPKGPGTKPPAAPKAAEPIQAEDDDVMVVSPPTKKPKKAAVKKEAPSPKPAKPAASRKRRNAVLLESDDDDDKSRSFVVEASPTSSNAGATPTPAKKSRTTAADAAPKAAAAAPSKGTPPTAAPPKPVAPKSASKSAKKARTEEVVDDSTAKARAAVLAATEALPAQDGVRFTLMQEGATYGARDDTPEMLGQKEVPRGHPDCLHGLTFVLSGVLESLRREDAESLIKRHGGRITGAVSGKTSFLLVGRATGTSKFNAARQKNTRLIDEDGLFSLIRASAPFAPAHAPAPRPPPPATINKGHAVAPGAPGARELKPASTNGQLWVEKYKPTSTAELVGNNTLVATLRAWLSDWQRVHLHGGAPAEAKGKGSSTKPKDMTKKAVLLSGPPGIGKTSAAHIVCREAGFQAVEVNASETRNKADKGAQGGVAGKLSNAIKELSTNTTIGWVGGRPDAHQQSSKVCLIMDEVDGMSGSDRGGVQDLIQTIQKSKIPIICICNDKYNMKLRSLRNHTLELDFRRPTKVQIAKRMSDIARTEGLVMTDATMDALIEGANSDIRLILGQMQMVRLRAKHISFDDVRRGMGATKDYEMSPFEAARKLLSPESSSLSLSDQLDLVFQDMDLVPLLIQENYPNHKPRIAQSEAMRMQVLAKAADALSQGDVVARVMRQGQNWGLMPFAGLVGTVYPSAYMRGNRETFHPMENNFPRFTAWLGQNSTSGKQRRLLGDIHMRMLSSDGPCVDRTQLRLYYLPALRPMLTTPLRLREKEGIPEVVDAMHTYCLMRDDLDFVLDVTKFKTAKEWGADPYKDVPAAVKSAFTRAFNAVGGRAKCGAMLPDAKKVSKGRRGAGEAVLEEVDAVPGEGVVAAAAQPDASKQEEEDEEDEDAVAKAEKMQRTLAKRGVQVQLKSQAGGSKKRGGSGASGKSSGGRGRKAAVK